MKKNLLLAVLLALSMAAQAWADVSLNIKLNFFGSPKAGQGGSSVATSFYLKSLVQRNLQVPFSTEALLTELKKTFNAPGVSLLADGDLVWESGDEPSVSQIVQINGRDIALILTPLPRPGAVNFKVGVVEEKDKKNLKNILLDTEIVLPDREVAMLGFRDSSENSYFVAFYVQSRKESLAKDAMRLSDGDKPRKIKDVKPVFPAEAREKGIEGAVVLEAVIDANGRVKAVQTLSSPAPVLAEAAKAAVSQWVYEPYLVNGKAKDVIFTATINFRLNPEDKAKPAGDALTRLEDSQKPKITKMVKPVYPEQALKNRLQGIVKLEAAIDENGKVKFLHALESPDPFLTEAALAAVKQWEYEPYVLNGKAKKVVFTVTVTFALHKD